MEGGREGGGERERERVCVCGVRECYPLSLQALCTSS